MTETTRRDGGRGEAAGERRPGGPPRDHGGGLDTAIARYRGSRADWLDLSTGINPVPYPVPDLPADAWSTLPDTDAANRLVTAARSFWGVPAGAGLLAAPGLSALIAKIPSLTPAATVRIDAPTYNEHAAAFRAYGWRLGTDRPSARVVVHPNNPDGALWSGDHAENSDLVVIDESFCDTCPEQTHIAKAATPGTLVLKSFGKFWGLAGLRLGFAIGDPNLIARLADMLGPWPVSGPALTIGAKALSDRAWADRTRVRLTRDSAQLDGLLTGAGAQVTGGTPLFRLYRVDDAATWQHRLANHHIWSRIFPYSTTWLRLGLPPPAGWDRLQTALNGTAGGATSRAGPGASAGPPDT